MNVCQKHWNVLREAVKVRGMDHLVAKSGQEAAQAMVDELNGTKTLDQWDPLMAMHFNLGGKIMERVGLAALQPGFCYGCAIQDSYDSFDNHPELGPRPPEALDFQGWVDSCADAMLKYAREKKLVTEPS